jgi:hypothetical protein
VKREYKPVNVRPLKIRVLPHKDYLAWEKSADQDEFIRVWDKTHTPNGAKKA